jgi:serine/threonine protein kinase/tetratricopeptide (TPR) repeat protein
MIGKTLGHYRIVGKLGSGGMGVVYKAEDTMLRRTVAVKVLPAETQQDMSVRKRFIREAQSAAALDHPFICTIHEVGESEGRDFIVMEYVDGQTLKSKLEEGPLTVKEALQTAIEVAEAVEVAHEKGIVHRDLKPANIMLTQKGHAKVMDFGLAKTLAPHDGAQSCDETATMMTQPGSVIGTLAYMSPEQLVGGAIDARSDIFSLGVVFYEMLCREHPFQAATPMAISDRILHQKPRPLAQLNSETPAQLQQIIEKMISKKREDRHESMREVLQELRNTTHAGPHGRTSPLPSFRWFQHRRVAVLLLAVLFLLLMLVANSTVRRLINRHLQKTNVPENINLAILPFEAIGGNAETEAFCKGLTEMLNAQLTRLTESRSFQVVPSNEVRAQNVLSLEQARREFGVNLVLEGYLQQAGAMLRVSYSLVDAITHRQSRADTITAPADDPFTMEDQVLASVVGNLNIELRPNERVQLSPQLTHQPEAYDFYLRGLGYLQDYYKRDSIESAINVFRRALELDGKYALARAGLGEAYWRMYELTQEEQWVEQAQSSCAQAVATDSALSNGHACLGIVYAGTGKNEQAVQEFQRAILLDPTNDDAYRGMANAYEKLGRTSEAEKTYRRGINLRPHYWAGYNWLGAFYCSQGRYDEAAAMFNQVIRLAPDCYRGYSNLGGTYLFQGRYSEATPLFERSLSLRPTASAYSNLGTARFFQRQFSEAARAYEEAAKLNEREWLVWGNLGDAYSRASGKRGMAPDAYRRALTLVENRLRINPRDTAALGYASYYHAMLKEKTEALACARHAVAMAPADPELLFNVALTYNQLGEVDEAFAMLQRSLAAGFSRSTVQDTPLIDNLQNDLRFRQLLNIQ